MRTLFINLFNSIIKWLSPKHLNLHEPTIGLLPTITPTPNLLSLIESVIVSIRGCQGKIELIDRFSVDNFKTINRITKLENLFHNLNTFISILNTELKDPGVGGYQMPNYIPLNQHAVESELLCNYLQTTAGYSTNQDVVDRLLKQMEEIQSLYTRTLSVHQIDEFFYGFFERVSTNTFKEIISITNQFKHL